MVVLAWAGAYLAPFARAEETVPKDRPAALEALFAGEIAEQNEDWKVAADAYWKAIENDEGFFAAHVRYQNACRHSGADMTEVAKDYDSWIKDHPESLLWKIHRLRLRSVQERLEGFQALAKAHADDVNVKLELGRALLDADDPAKAVRELDDAHDHAPDRIDVVLLLSRAHLAKSDEKKARRVLTAAAGDGGGDPRVHLDLARMSLADGKYEIAIREADLVLETDLAGPTAHLIKAEALERTDHRAEAIAVLEACRERSGDGKPVLIALAELVGRTDAADALTRAGALFAQVLASDETDFRALSGMGWVREREGKYAEAETHFRAALAQQPFSAAAVDSVGYQLFKQGRLTDAQVQFRKAMDLDPEYVPAYNNMAATHDAKAEYTEAIEWYQKVLKMRGHAENLRAITNQAFDYEQLGEFKKAEKLLRKALDLREDDAPLAVWLGDNLYFQEKFRDAGRQYQKAIDIDEESFFAWRGLGMAMAQQERWVDAVKALEQAKKLDDSDKDVLLALGGIYLSEIEDLQKALNNFELYVEKGGGDPDVPEIIDEIRKELDG